MTYRATCPFCGAVTEAIKKIERHQNPDWKFIAYCVHTKPKWEDGGDISEIDFNQTTVQVTPFVAAGECTAEMADWKARRDHIEGRFTVTENHLKLLATAAWDWNQAEFGAPSIDGKRPFGNSGFDTIYEHIAETIGLPVFVDADEEKHLSKEQLQECEKIYGELATVLEVCTKFRSFECRTYYRKRTYDKWEIAK